MNIHRLSDKAILIPIHVYGLHCFLLFYSHHSSPFLAAATLWLDWERFNRPDLHIEPLLTYI